LSVYHVVHAGHSGLVATCLTVVHEIAGLNHPVGSSFV